MRGAIPPLLQYVFMAWCLVTHRDNFTFYSTTLQCMKLMDHVTLYYNNMSMDAVFLEIEKTFDTT
jgi:hypothetical protein